MVNKNFTITRGNTLQFRLNFINGDIVPTELKFILKNKSSDSESVFELSLGNGIIKVPDMYSYDFYIPASYTENLELLNYIYQIEMRYDQDCATLVEGKLIITPEL